MVLEAKPIDLEALGVPELARLAERVRRTGMPIVLREDGEDVAVLSPARPKRRVRFKHPTQAELDAALATFGTWSDLDAEKLLRELDEARSDSRSPIEL